MRKICYTALIGDYDNLLPPSENPGWEFVCFTTLDIQVPGWEMIKVKPWSNPKRQARFAKANPPFKGKCQTLWIDARFEIHGSLDEFVSGIHANLAVMKHPARTTVMQEAEEVILLGLDNPERVRSQVRRYRHILQTNKHVLPALGIIYRKTHTRKFNKLWWNEIKNGSHRDQLSFNYSAIVTETKFEFLEGSIYSNSHKTFKLHKHKWPRQSHVPI